MKIENRIEKKERGEDLEEIVFTLAAFVCRHVCETSA